MLVILIPNILCLYSQHVNFKKCALGMSAHAIGLQWNLLNSYKALVLYSEIILLVLYTHLLSDREHKLKMVLNCIRIFTLYQYFLLRNLIKAGLVSIVTFLLHNPASFPSSECIKKMLGYYAVSLRK